MPKSEERTWSKEEFKDAFMKIKYAADKYFLMLPDLAEGIEILNVLIDPWDNVHESVGIKRYGDVMSFYVNADRMSIEKISDYFSKISRLISPEKIKKDFLEIIEPSIKDYFVKKFEIDKKVKKARKEISDILS